MNKNIQYKNIHLIIPADYAYQRLDHALVKLLPETTRSQIQTWIADGELLLNGASTKASTKLKGGEIITANITLITVSPWEAQAIPLDIVYEDDSLLLINKPAGLVVHPGAGNKDQTLLNALLHHAPILHQIPRAGILHRLDKNTTGLLMVAKTSSALASLTAQLQARTLLREYQAVVYGNLISGGTVNAPIDRHPLQRKQMAVIETGKPAITHYRILEKYRYHTLLTVRLETGRTHQIRVHLSYIRHPIVGDKAYGGRVKLGKQMTETLISALRGFQRQALHAYALGFIHPETQEAMRFQVDLPEDMQALILALKTDRSSI
jgi:23S rRNA pseudouridine1911/1915/1917 synthase